MQKNKTIKQKGFKPELTKIKLNPEQAVLSCCDIIERLHADAVSQCDAVGGYVCGTQSHALGS